MQTPDSLKRIAYELIEDVAAENIRYIEIRYSPILHTSNGMTLEEANQLRESDPQQYIKESYRTMGEHCQAMLDLQKMGAVTFDYGNNLRGQAMAQAGIENAFDFPGFVPAYIRTLFCEALLAIILAIQPFSNRS